MANGVPESSTLDLEMEWTWNKSNFVKSIIQKIKDVETKLDHVFWGTVPTASNLQSLSIPLSFFFVIQTYILYLQMFTPTYWIQEQML